MNYNAFFLPSLEHKSNNLSVLVGSSGLTPITIPGSDVGDMLLSLFSLNYFILLSIMKSKSPIHTNPSLWWMNMVKLLSSLI